MKTRYDDLQVYATYNNDINIKGLVSLPLSCDGSIFFILDGGVGIDQGIAGQFEEDLKSRQGAEVHILVHGNMERKKVSMFQARGEINVDCEVFFRINDGGFTVARNAPSNCDAST
ncbi:hypothetical protein Drorol1_Dr00008506 [Drosera rotundifolia]